MGRVLLCCKVCGTCFCSDNNNVNCEYCGGNTDVLFTKDEIQGIDEHEVKKMIEICREKYKNTDEYNEELWKSREYKENIKKFEKIEIEKRVHRMTTGYNFEGYNIVDYKGIVNGQIVLGTGFLSEFTASFADVFGTKSQLFADKMEKAKSAATDIMIKKSVEMGGNAIIGVDFDYIVFYNNMLGVVANGTSVSIKKLAE